MNKLLLFCLLLTGCIGGGFEPNKQPSGKIVVQPDTVYMGAAGWTISYSPGMPKNPTDIDPLATAKAVSGWYFNFPASDGVHYIEVPYNANLPHKTLTITYRVSGTGKFVSVDDPCRGPGFSPILERQGDTLSPTQEYFRFWGAAVPLVVDGQIHTVSWPLAWDKWTGVFGKSNQAEFATTMKNLMGVGVTFGGCYAGHGVYVSGSKTRFELLNYQIQ